MGVSYILVIDTNAYSGNFERQMTAFCTGQVGDCEVGYREALRFVAEVPEDTRVEMARIVDRRPDEHGCKRPTSVWPTPGRVNNGRGMCFDAADYEGKAYPAYESVAIFFNQIPPTELLDLIVLRAEKFARTYEDLGTKEISPLAIKGVRLLAEEVSLREIPR